MHQRERRTIEYSSSNTSINQTVTLLGTFSQKYILAPLIKMVYNNTPDNTQSIISGQIPSTRFGLRFGLIETMTEYDLDI